MEVLVKVVIFLSLNSEPRRGTEVYFIMEFLPSDIENELPTPYTHQVCIQKSQINEGVLMHEVLLFERYAFLSFVM